MLEKDIPYFYSIMDAVLLEDTPPIPRYNSKCNPVTDGDMRVAIASVTKVSHFYF
jgi:hypothetical protein